MDDLERFCSYVFNSKPEEAYILVWTLPGKVSYWCQTPQEVIDTIRKQLDPKDDIYLGCGWATKPLGKSKRARREQVCGIPGIWADIDIVGDAHKAKNYPETLEDALAFIRQIAPEPSCIVFSGHGIHIWWLFTEAWIFESAEDRAKAESLLEQWKQYLHTQFSTRGWTLDAVSDLPRVLRFAGTYNNKDKNEPIRTYLYSDSDIDLDDSDCTRYDIEYLKEYVEKQGIFVEAPASETNVIRPKFGGIVRREEHGNAVPAARPVAQSGYVPTFTIDPNAEPPFTKWRAACKNIPEFKDTWERTRTDKKSQSEYDASLLKYAVQAEWNDQELCDLLVAYRREYSDTLQHKGLRADYVAATIKFVRTGESYTPAERKIIEEHDIEEPDDNRILTEVNNIMNAPDNKQIIKMRCIRDDTGSTYVYFSDGMHEYFGEAKDFFVKKKWEDFLARVYFNTMKPMKNKNTWYEFIQRVRSIVEIVESSDEGRDDARLCNRLHEYLYEHAGAIRATRDGEDAGQYIRTNDPVTHRGEVIFTLTGLLGWMRRQHQELMTNKRAAAILKSLDSEQRVPMVYEDATTKSGRTSRMYMTVPKCIDLKEILGTARIEIYEEEL